MRLAVALGLKKGPLPATRRTWITFAVVGVAVVIIVYLALH